MFVEEDGNIFDADVQVIVNPVNSVGVMGGGLAAAFERKFPDACKAYNISCKMFYKSLNVQEGSTLFRPSMIPVNNSPFSHIMMFPTKKHWRNPSELSFIETNMPLAMRILKKNKIKSVAFPRLGCGLGGLKWDEVKPVMEAATVGFDDIDIKIIFS